MVEARVCVCMHLRVVVCPPSDRRLWIFTSLRRKTVPVDCLLAYHSPRMRVHVCCAHAHSAGVGGAWHVGSVCVRYVPLANPCRCSLQFVCADRLLP